MKMLNLLLLALGGSLTLVMAVAISSEYFFGREIAMLITVPIALAAGMSARRLAEKFLGYTTLEAMKDGSDDSSN